MKRLTVAIVAAIVSSAAFADPASGWKQTGAGPYVYDDPANWVDGVVNGEFGSDLTLTRSTVTRQWDDKYYFYPIPQTELKKNSNLTQNQGW